MIARRTPPITNPNLKAKSTECSLSGKAVRNIFLKLSKNAAFVNWVIDRPNFFVYYWVKSAMCGQNGLQKISGRKR